MQSGSAALSRAVFVGVVAAWSVVAISVGLLAVLDWPHKFRIPGRLVPIIGLSLVAVGQFMSAMVADQLFPRAHKRVTGFFELAPWVVLAIIVIGGLT